ncbi:MAG: hypothetical protein IJN89_02080 [Anaerotignum sp.]|nr:hypothetical protein [Anaerotignum sp.]
MAKKTFMGNPAMQFITNPEEQTQPVKEEAVKLPDEAAAPEAAEVPDQVTAPQKAPEGYKLNPLYIEKKSRRLQLLMQPSLYAKVKENADAAGLSVNDYIHQALEEKTARKE